jgi:hypothetical protein
MVRNLHFDRTSFETLWNKKVLFHMMSRKIAIVEDEEFIFNRFEKKYDSEKKLETFSAFLIVFVLCVLSE